MSRLCLVKITTDNIIESTQGDNQCFGKLSMLNIAELDLIHATNIYNYINKHKRVIVTPSIGYGNNKVILLKCTLIEGVDEINVIKNFFSMDKYYSNTDYNFITLITNHIKIEHYTKIALSIREVSDDYKFVSDMLAESLKESLEDCDGLDRQINHVENIVGIIKLTQQKLSRIINYDTNITRIIGNYLNMEDYKEYLEEIHPELYGKHKL